MDTITIAGRKYDEKGIAKEKEEYVRLEAVDLCFGLKHLIFDKSALVRTAVARKKIGHELFVNDKSWRVRATVAKYSDDPKVLDQLLKDENDFVRFVLVKRGHGLVHFTKDTDEEIVSIARYQLQKQKNKKTPGAPLPAL